MQVYAWRGPPPRRSLERGGIAVRAALAACQNGSRCCATSLGRRTRAQRNRSRRKRSTFLWGARCARGPPGLPSAEFHDDGDTCDSLYEYQGLSGYGMVPKEMQWCDDRNESRTASCQHQRVPPCEGQDKTLFNVNIKANFVGLNTELGKKRVCELEEKQWRTDRNESGSESMTEYAAPAPAVYSATPAPPIELVTPSPVIEYSAPAPPVTCFSPSPQFPTMADRITGVTTSVDDACPRLRSFAEHCDLTADDSQDECLADGMPSYVMACPCRTSTPHRVMIGCTARRWPVRRRGTCDARHTTQEHKENRTPTRRELQILGGRIGLFVEWDGAELKQYTNLITIAWWEHDETEDAERELRTLRDGARRLILHLLHMQNTAPPKSVRRSKRPARRKRR